MGIAFVIGAAALALGAVIVALFLPARAHDDDAASRRPTVRRRRARAGGAPPMPRPRWATPAAGDDGAVTAGAPAPGLRLAEVR